MNFDGNFLRLGAVNVDALRELVERLTPAQWAADGLRQQRYEVHRDTETINLVHDADFRHRNPTRHPALQVFAAAMRPVLAMTADFYDQSPQGKLLTEKNGVGYFIRANLVRLKPGGEIAEHQDKNFSLAHSHRVHVPIVTNDQVRFTVGDESVSLSAGEVYEINNRRLHSVRNDGPEFRVHLILDYVLNGEMCCCGKKRHPDIPCSAEACLETDRLQIECQCFDVAHSVGDENTDASLLDAVHATTRNLSDEEICTILGDPTIILSAPRSGSGLLFEQMASVPGFCTIGGESHAIFKAFDHLHAENTALDSGALDATHADARTARDIRRAFFYLLQDHAGTRPETSAGSSPAINLLEKTPRNALNIPFLLAIFPNAKFIYLYRDAPQTIASLIEAWTHGLQAGRFVTYEHLPDWDRQGWCFLLPPGWRKLRGKSLAEIATFQWVESNRAIIGNLEQVPRNRWTSVSYRELIASPSAEIGRLCSFAGINLSCGAPMIDNLPTSRTTLTEPDAQKWRVHQNAIFDLQSEWQATTQLIEKITAGR